MKLALFLPWRSVYDRQDRFRSARKGQAQSDDEFLSHVQRVVPQREQALVFAIRDVVAQFSNLEPGFIHAEDGTLALNSIMYASTFWGWFFTLGDNGPDEESFFIALGEQATMRINAKVFVGLRLRSSAIELWQSDCRFGDWAAWLASEIAKTLDDSQ